MKSQHYFIFDFDSTIVQLEALDELANIALMNALDKAKKLTLIKQITNDGMEGKISFDESLIKRLELFAPTKKDITQLVKLLIGSITPSILQNRDFFRNYAQQIYILSGGFEDYILPVVRNFGITQTHVLANKFTFDTKGTVTGFVDRNLAKKDGKILAIKSLALPGNVTIIGDGYTDLQIRQNGAADCFFAFTEINKRETVVQKADHVADSFSSFLQQFQLIHNTQF